MATNNEQSAAAVLLELLRPFGEELGRVILAGELRAWPAAAQCRRLYGGILWGGSAKPVDFLQAFGPRTLAAAEELLDALLDWLPDMDTQPVLPEFDRRVKELAELVASLASAAASEFDAAGPDITSGFEAVRELCSRAAAMVHATRPEQLS